MMIIRIRDGKGEYKGYNCVDPIDPTGCTGIHVEAPCKSCFFCKHCTDISWDYSHGPYMFECDNDIDVTNEELKGNCKYFEGEEK